MRKGLLTLVAALVMVAVVGSAVYAGDEFEDGYKTELGAIAARATVGLGVGLVTGAVHGTRHHQHHRYYSHHRPYYTRVVVYRPYPVRVRRVERRVVYYAPPPPVYWSRY